MKRDIFGFGKRIFRSELACLLLSLHLVLVLYRFAPTATFKGGCNLTSRPPGWIYVARDYFHFTYEDLWFQILVMLDLPALLISEAILSIFSSFAWCDYTKSWIIAILWLILASMQ